VLTLGLNSGSLFDGINPVLVDIDWERTAPGVIPSCAAGKLPGN
jgi:hypothetical protein